MKKLKEINEVEVQNYALSKKHNKKKFAYVFMGISLLVLFVVSSLIQIGVSNSLITEGITLSTIQQEIDATKKDNLILSEKLYTDASLTNIASQAATLGFVEASTPVYLTEQTPLAIR